MKKMILFLVLVLLFVAPVEAFRRGTGFNEGDLLMDQNSIQFEEVDEDPDAPPVGHIKVYAKDDGGGDIVLFFKNDAGTVTEIGSGGGGSSLWLSGSGTIYTTDNVGIGTVSPAYQLNVVAPSGGGIEFIVDDDVFRIIQSSGSNQPIVTGMNTLRFNTPIIPHSDNTRDLGTTTLRWNDIYTYDLIADGNVDVAGAVRRKSDTNTYIDFGINDSMRLWAGGKSFIHMIEQSQDEIDFGDNGDVDYTFFTAGADTFIRGSDGFVGIGTTSPQARLHVNGDLTVSTDLTARGFYLVDGTEITGESFGLLQRSTIEGDEVLTTVNANDSLEIDGDLTVNGLLWPNALGYANQNIQGNLTLHGNLSVSNTTQIYGDLREEVFHIVDPDSAQAITDTVGWWPIDASTYPNGIAIEKITLATDASSTYAVNVEEFTSPTDGSPSTIDAITTSAGTEATETTISDPDVASGSYVVLDLDTDDINWMTLTIYYREK